MKKRILSFALVLCFVLTLLPAAFADSAPTSGKCGDNLTWRLDGDGTLTISGTGKMWDYDLIFDNVSYRTSAPWGECYSSITSVVINDGITNIGGHAFRGCSSLTSVTIPDSVTRIEGMAFLGCSKIKVVNYDGNIESWLGIDFADDGSNPCDGSTLYFKGELVTNAVIPDSITSIKNWSFSGCSSLTSVTIPDSVTSIKNWSFSDCSSLTSVTIPDSVTSIGSGAFDGCSSLTSVTIPDSVTSIEGGAFDGCSSLTSVTIPDSVTRIEYGAFRGCSSLTSVTIPDSVTSIEVGAFSGCSSLTSVTIPDSVTSIEEGAFSACSSLTSVTIGNGVTSINDSFSGCVSLKSFTVSESNSAYSSKDGVLFNKNKTKLITYPAGKTNTSYTIPNSVTSIEDGAFCASKLEKMNIPSSVSNIGISAFTGCSSLTSITIPNSVSKISYGTFERCENLKSVTIPTSVKSIDVRAFYGCSSLTSVTIPDSVTSIGGWAFYGCDSLSDIYYKGTVSQWKAVKVEAFNNPLKNATIHYVPNVPAAPALKITTSAGKPKISWNAVDGAVKYWVYRSTDGKNFRYYDSTTKTSYTNNSTSIGTTYYYKVKAVAVVDGKNYASNYSVAKSIQCKPAAPTVSINRSNGKPKLSWKAVSGATKYWIYRSTDGVNFKYWDSTTKTSYTNSGAASGTKYYYRVKAVAVVNGKTVVSANSSTKSLFTSLAKPSVSITTSNGKPKITWNAVTGADKYYVYRSTDGKNFSYWDSTTKTTYVNSGAKKNTKYYYKVKAVCASNSNANSAQSATVSIKATK